MSYDKTKLRETIKLALKNHYSVDTEMCLRWHKVGEFDPQFIYENFDSLTSSDLKRLLKGTFMEEAVAEL